MKTKIVATPLCDLTNDLGDRYFQWLSIGARRDALVFSSEKRLKHKGARIKGVENQQFKIHHWRNGEVQEVDLPSTSQTFHFVQVLGEDYICVAGRCADKEKNAHIFDKQGQLLRSWHAGDGIEDVQTTANGQIWVSYFDEGVYSGSEISHQGLVCFDSQGQRTFGFFDTNREVDAISDCYALNVCSNRDTWLCYYTQFARVLLREKNIHKVYDPVPEMIGSHAFAVSGNQFLFVGGYHYKEQIFWRDESRNLQVELETVDDEGEPFCWNRVCGRGADLFLCDGPKVWMLSLTEIGF